MISRRIDGSICGAILPNLPSSSWSRSGRPGVGAHAARQVRACWSYHARGRILSGCVVLWRGLATLRFTARGGFFHKKFGTRPISTSPYPVENDTTGATRLAHDARKNKQDGTCQAPWCNSKSKEELLAMVDSYEHAGTVEEHLRFFQDPYRRGYAPADGPNVVVSDLPDDHKYPDAATVRGVDEQEQENLRNLWHAVTSACRNPYQANHDLIFAMYKRVPEPRMVHIMAPLRHRLFRVLGSPDKRDSKSMLRYFALMADVKNCGLALTRYEWNLAISFAARYVGTSTAVELESALQLWREMEQKAGIHGNEVTFNILFDVASKAGNFVLGEMIYGEMERRGYPPTRYHRVSLIHYFGLKGDSDGVRAAYRQMVLAGEIIDSLALNCVIASMLRCGEQASAEYTYERMRDAGLAFAEAMTSGKPQRPPGQLPSLPARTYATNKALTRVFRMFSRLSRREPLLAPSLQGGVSMAPDLHTYRILINHYAVTMGDIVRTARMLDEMTMFGVQLHGAVFLALFKGFGLHGGGTQAQRHYQAGDDRDGSSRNPWSPRRLEGVWNALTDALDDGADGLEVRTWLAMEALRAMQSCYGCSGSMASRARVLDAYEALRARWMLDHSDAQFMVEFLNRLLKM